LTREIILFFESSLWFLTFPIAFASHNRDIIHLHQAMMQPENVHSSMRIESVKRTPISEVPKEEQVLDWAMRQKSDIDKREVR